MTVRRGPSGDGPNVSFQESARADPTAGIGRKAESQLWFPDQQRGEVARR